jgi:hypothetical protein
MEEASQQKMWTMMIVPKAVPSTLKEAGGKHALYIPKYASPFKSTPFLKSGRANNLYNL